MAFTIGIIGICRNAGTTHLAVGISVYLTEVCHRKTALLEYNDHQDFHNIELFCRPGKKSKTPFDLLKADYYKHAWEKELLLCMDRGYDAIILDCGSMEERGRTEFARCSRKIVIGSLCEWQAVKCLKFYQSEIPKKDKSWQYLMAFGSEESRQQVCRQFGIDLRRIPLNSDPYGLNYEMIACIEDLL